MGSLTIKSLNEKDIEILTSISKLLNSRTLFSSKRNEILKQMELLDGKVNVRLIRFLLLFSMDKDKEVADSAGKLLKNHLDCIEHDEIKWIDHFFRNSRDLYQLDKQLRETSFDVIASRVKRSEYSSYICCALSMHESGYVREFALKKLLNAEIKRKVVFFAIRANDWVVQVRLIACKGLEILIADDQYFDSILESLTLFSNINLWRRGDTTKIQLALRSKLVCVEKKSVILAKFKKTKKNSLKRELFKYVLLNSEMLTETILEGLKTKDPIILRLCIEEFEKNREKVNELVILNMLKKSRSSICKKASIPIAKSLLEEQDFIYFAKKMLFDKSSIVREIARWYLKDYGNINFTEMYKAELQANPTNSYSCIGGLKEINAISTFDIVKMYLKDDKPKTRRIALATLVYFDFQNAKNDLLDVLVSDNEVDSRFAMKLLNKNPRNTVLISRELIEIIGLEGFSENVYNNIITLYVHFSKWDRLIESLRLFDIDHLDVSEGINLGLWDWYTSINRSFVKPSEKQVREIKSLYSKHKGKIDKKLIVYLDKIIETL